MKDNGVSVKIKKEKKIFIFFIMILITIISFILIFKTDLFSVKRIDVIGVGNLTSELVTSEAGVDYGTHIFKVDLENIEQNLKYNPYVKEVKVTRKIPHTINIVIKERSEFATIKFMDSYIIIDDETMVLRTTFNKEQLIQIEGIEFENFVEGERLNAKDKSQVDMAIKVIKNTKENSIYFESIDVSNVFDVIMQLNKNLTCKIGNGNKLESRINTLRKIIKDLESKDITRGIIDMSHDGYPTYRPVE